VLLEPIQGEAGVVVPPPGYLQRAREVADGNGALLWVDEVQTGVGRTGAWFAFQHEGVRPDIVTVAKGLGGGFPIGACVALGAVDSFEPGQHGSTFGGNPVACAVALSVLDTISTEGLLDEAKTVGHELAGILADQPGVSEVRGRGLLLGAVLDSDSAAAVAWCGLDHGVIVNDCQPNVVRLAPPLILGEDGAAEARQRLDASFAAAMAGAGA
jgi:acetylornithine aminotransferase